MSENNRYGQFSTWLFPGVISAGIHVLAIALFLSGFGPSEKKDAPLAKPEMPTEVKAAKQEEPSAGAEEKKPEAEPVRDRNGGTKASDSPAAAPVPRRTNPPVAETTADPPARRPSQQQPAPAKTADVTSPGRQPATAVSTGHSPVPAAARYTTHVVRSGDNFTLIARRYGLTTAELAKLNGKKLSFFNRISVGQKIRVPLLAEGERP